MAGASCVAFGIAGKFLSTYRNKAVTQLQCVISSLILYRPRSGVTLLFGFWGLVWGTIYVSEQMR